MENTFGSPASTNTKNTDHATQVLIKSCRGHLDDGSNGQSQSLRFIDVQQACDELLNFSFHSEEGRLQVIKKLTELNGNFVVKVIRKGLLSLSKVYSDSKTFEDESLKLVDLCCSQFHCVQRGNEKERLVASPAAIINWTMELCDELVTNQSSSSQSIVSMSSSVSKIKDLYESILVSGIIIEECKMPRYAYEVWFVKEIFTFEGINRVLKPKIHSEGFEDVIEQTAAIVRRDPENKHFICATVLSKWLKLLEISSVTNWFAAQVAKHDLVVHLESSKEEISISGNINDTSLICQVFDAIKSLMGSDDKYECLCEKERLIILFNFPEVFRLLPKACIKLIQSTRDVCTKVIEDIFSILANNLTKNAATKGSYPYHFDGFGFNIEERAENFMLIDEHTGAWKHSFLNPALDLKKLSLNAITQALLTIPDKQQVLKILQIWKQTFPDDKSHRVLSELFVLVIEVLELKRESIVIDMENLVIFLTECRTQLIDTLPLCRTLLPSLMNALPNSWYHPENINVMKMHFDKMTFVGRYSYHSVSNVDSFLTLLKSKPVPEKVKTNILQLGMDLLGEVNYANGYSESISPLTLSLVSLIDNAMIKRYALELLKIVKERGSALDNFYPIMDIINAIGKSCLIERKQEMLEELARLIKGTRKGNETAMLSACREFLKFSVNENNAKRFFVLAATGSYNSYQFIVSCLNYNQEILKGHTRVNSHVTFLLKTITEKLTSHAGHLELLTKVCDKCILRYDREKFNFPTIEIFETMVAAVSHDISVSEFDLDLSEATLRVTIAAVDTHRQDPPIDFHSFYVDLNRAFRESKQFNQQSLRYVTMEVLYLIAKLPFTLKRIKCLIQRFMAIFDQDISHDQEVLNVLFKLLQMNSNGLLSSLDDNDVYLTFEKLLVPTNISSSNASVRCSDYFILDHYKAIIAFEQTLSSLGLSSESNHYMAQKKEKKQDSQYSSFTSEVVEAITKRVWETNLKEKEEDFKQIMLRVPPIFTPLIGSCLKECYKFGFNDQPSVKTLTEEVLENAGSWRKLEIEIDAIGQILSKLSPDEKLGPLLVEHMRQCYILGLGEKPSSKTVILSILKGFVPWKKLKNEIMYIEKEVFNVSPDLVPYTSTCAEECRNSVDVGEEPNVKSLTLQILKSFEFHKRLENEIEKMEKELSPDVPEIVPSIAECMRQCYIAGLNEEPKIKPVILQMLEVIDQWKELYAKISGDEETTTSSCSELAFLVMACIKHWYILGLSEDGKRIRDFIMQIIEAIELFTWNDDEMNKVNKSCLKIPKQLYLIFKEAKHNEEAKKRIVKAFDVVRKLDPSVHEEDKKRESLIQLDFYLLLKESSVTATDVCSALLICKGLDDNYLLDFSTNLLENEYDIFDPVEGYMDLEISVLSHACASELREKEKSEFPSPGYVAYLVLNQLRRLGVPDSDLRETTQNICNKLLCYAFRDHGDRSAYSIYGDSADDKLRFAFNLMNESSYLTEFEYWLSSQKPHHFVAEYDDVIIKAVSWKKGRKSCEEAIRMNEEVYKTLSKLQKLIFEGYYVALGVVSKPKEIMGRILKTTEQEDIAFHLFHLLCKSATATETCLDIIPSWNEQESLSLVERLTHLYDKRGEKMAQRDLDKELEVGLQILPFAARKFPNSASKTISFLENIIEHNCGHEDNMSLKRLPLWYMEMTEAGYDPQAIESWCTSLVHTQNLSSRDVDAITNMTPENIKLLNKESDVVGKCLFSVETSKTKEYFKHRLILARLLNELASIANELKADLIAVKKIKKAVKSLCTSFSLNPNAVGNLYKDRNEILKELFFYLFGEEDEEYTESLKELANKDPLSKNLVILFRRLAKCFVSKPSTVRFAKKIVHAISDHTAKHSKWQYLDIQTVVHLEVLHFESNHDAIDMLQCAGYNQSASANEDLWYSSSIEMSAYVPAFQSLEESVLRQVWKQSVKPVLSTLNISGVKVNGKFMKISELFKPTDSLKMLDSQLEAAKQETNLKNNRQLVRYERRLRHNIDEQGKEVKKKLGGKLGKLVIVWENAFLECVKLCSEKIPDCYAPNGFHSEKPVICGIAVDNRILTLYKEDHGGTRTEVENVEVKLYPAGMVVFSAYRSIHMYDTEQMWAAFYKMLLDKRLVPKIFITNISPAFYWIKQFVTPEVTPPDRTNFMSCCTLIPSSEDSFDYDPEVDIPRLYHTTNTATQTELIILTPEKTKSIETHEIKPPNRNKLIREKIDKAVLHLQDDGGLREMHPKSHDKILDRLKFAIRHAVEIAVDEGKPTKESISRNIDMKRLLYRCEDGHQYSKDDYCAVILDAVNTVTEDLQRTKTPYDGCQHVVFFQPNESRMKID